MLMSLLLTPAALLQPFDVLAESNIVVEVRAIRAAEKSLIGINAGVDKVSVDSDIEDLRAKLETLPYEKYSLIAKEARAIPLKKREQIVFPGGFTLTVRPLAIEPQHVSLWLKWEDRDGQSLLDTRMHFDPGESVIAGTDSTANTGMLLAVNVREVTPAESH